MQRILGTLSILGFSVGLLMGTGACNSSSESEDSITTKKEIRVDTVKHIVMEVNQCARLYTSEYQIHKIVTHSDNPQVKGKVFGIPVNMKTRIGNRKVAIPINVTLKAYIDFAEFSEKNIERTDSTITVTLPDPHIIATGSKVDHKETRQFIDLTRSKFTDEEITNFSKQGADSIVSHASHFGIAEQAQRSAANHLIPIMKRMGYKEKNIIVRFRKDFTDSDLKSMIIKQ